MATSDRYAPFDVVVVPFPYSDRLAEKRRPAPSVVRAAKIACIEPVRVLRRAGAVDTRTARKIAVQLRSFLVK